MKKDYIPALLPDDSEVDFVQSYWTDVWERSGGPSLKFKSIQSSEEFKTINKFFKSLPLNSKILDAGCGLGNWTVELNSLGYNTVGLDLSTSTIVQLKSLFPNVVFDSGDLRNTSFDSSSLTLIFPGVFLSTLRLVRENVSPRLFVLSSQMDCFAFLSPSTT